MTKVGCRSLMCLIETVLSLVKIGRVGFCKDIQSRVQGQTPIPLSGEGMLMPSGSSSAPK